MAQGNDRTMLVAASGSDSDVQANTTGRSHRRRMIVGGTVGLGVALAVVLWRSYGRKDLATPAFKGDSLVSLATDEELCGHSASVCVSPLGSPGVFFTKDCLSGGLGCSASGKQCCRFCGAGDFATIMCPTAADKASPDKAAAAAADKAAAEMVDRGKKVADKIAADKVAAKNMVADNIAADEAAADKAWAEKAARDKKVADKIAADKVDEDNMIADFFASKKAATMVAVKIVADQAAADKMVADAYRAALGKTAADKAAADKMVADAYRAALGKTAADKASADKYCGHSASYCVHSNPKAFFTVDCLSGGLGCGALGMQCCRFCGGGDYVKCP